MLTAIRRAINAVRRRRHIAVDPIGYARSCGVQLGTGCRLLGLQPSTFGSEPYLVRLGDHVTVTGGVQFVTHDGGVWVFREEHPEIDVVRPISVGNNVFVGANAILLPGVVIGSNVVIAAGSVVTHDVADNSIVGGVPARPLGDIEDYRTRMLEEGHPTKSMTQAAKRSYYEKLFPPSAGADSRS